MIHMMPSVQTLIFGMSPIRAARRRSLGIEEAIDGMSNSCDAVLSFRKKFPESWSLLTEKLGIADAAIESELLRRAEDTEPEPSREISEEGKRIFPLTMQIQMQSRVPIMSAPVKDAMKACNRLVRERKAEVTEVDFLRQLLSQECLAASAFGAVAPEQSVLFALDSLPAERKHIDPFQNIREAMDAVVPGQSGLVKLPEGVDWRPPEVEYRERPPEPDHVPSDIELKFNEDLMRDLEEAKGVQREFSDSVLRLDHIFLMFLRRQDSLISAHLLSDGQDIESWIVQIERWLREIGPYPWKSEIHHEVGELLPTCHVLPEIEEWWKREDGTIAEPGDSDFEEVAAANQSKAYDQPYSEMLWLDKIFVYGSSRFARLYRDSSYYKAHYEEMRKRYERPAD